MEAIVRAGNVEAKGYYRSQCKRNTNPRAIQREEQRQFQTRDPTRPTRRDEKKGVQQPERQAHARDRDACTCKEKEKGRTWSVVEWWCGGLACCCCFGVKYCRAAGFGRNAAFLSARPRPVVLGPGEMLHFSRPAIFDQPANPKTRPLRFEGFM